MTTYDFDRDVDLDFRNGKVQLVSTNSFIELKSAKTNLDEHYSNGLSKYIQQISINVIEDEKECKNIWQKFSKNESLFDNWDFRKLFFDGYDSKPYFLTIKKGDSVLACLPLMYQKPLNEFTWFGSDWMENNRFFTVNKFYIPILLYFAPKPLSLPGLNMRDIDGIPEFIKFEEDYTEFFLKLEEYGNMDNYLKSLNKKKRYNLKRDHRIIESKNPLFVIGGDFKSDFYNLIEKRMHSLGEMAYFEEDRGNRKAFDNLFEYKGKDFSVDLWTIIIDGDVAVCDLVVFYNNTVYPLLGGNNVDKYYGIVNYINFKEIDLSLNQGYKKIYFLQIRYGWKYNYLK